jgi:response regulator NasT
MRSPQSAPIKLRIVIATANPEQHDDPTLAAQARRASTLRIGLADHELVASLAADRFLAERIARLQPDLLILDAAADARGVLAHIALASGDQRRPVVLFTDDASIASMDAAIAAGVSAYIVAGLQAERIAPVLHVALARFRQEQKLLGELADTRHKLAERKVIERAKGVLMRHRHLSEEQAHQHLRSMAMNNKLKLGEVAQRILDVEDLL